jgi:transposase
MVIGIDVAKAELVVATRPSGERWTVVNDERGVRTLVERFRRDSPELIVLEPLGRTRLNTRPTARSRDTGDLTRRAP